MDDEDYQKSFECIEFLRAERPKEYTFTVLDLFHCQWEQHLAELRKAVPGERLTEHTKCVVYSPDFSSLWTGDGFVREMASKAGFKIFTVADPTDPASYAVAAKRRYVDFLKKTGHTFCYFEITIGAEHQPERVVFELFTDTCPRTSFNFQHLCTGDLPAPTDPSLPHPVSLNYRGSRFFRIVKDSWIQGGDIVNNKGNGGYSAFGPAFPDEGFSIRHDQEGILGMANNGPHTNSSQFYVTLGPNQWMDNKYVAFGRVVEGMSVLRRISRTPTKPNQQPEKECVVSACGELRLD